MEYFIYLTTTIFIYAILAISLNLVAGYTGLFSMTQASFFGIGAYASAILTTRYGLPFSYSILVGILITTLVSFLVGIISNNFKNDYYMLVTLAFNAIIFGLFVNWQSVTHGSLGIYGIQKPALLGHLFPESISFLILVFIFFLPIYLISYFMVKSPFGIALRAIREDEKVAQLFGYNIKNYKLSIFIIGAIMAGIAGSLFASQVSFISPPSFALSESIFILSMIILGGLSDLNGSLLGAIFLVILPEFLSFIGFSQEVAAQMRQALYGLALVFIILYCPKGILGKYEL